MTIREIIQQVRARHRRQYDPKEGEAMDFYLPRLQAALTGHGYGMNEPTVAIQSWAYLFGPACDEDIPAKILAEMTALVDGNSDHSGKDEDTVAFHRSLSQKIIAFGLGWKRVTVDGNGWMGVWMPAFQELAVVCRNLCRPALNLLVTRVEGFEDSIAINFPRRGQVNVAPEVMKEINQLTMMLAYTAIGLFMGDEKCRPSKKSPCRKFGSLHHWDPEHSLYSHLMISLVGDQKSKVQHVGQGRARIKFDVLAYSFTHSLLAQSLLVCRRITFEKKNAAIRTCLPCKKNDNPIPQMTLKVEEPVRQKPCEGCGHTEYVILAQERLFISDYAMKRSFRKCKTNLAAEWGKQGEIFHYLPEDEGSSRRNCKSHSLGMSSRLTWLAVSGYFRTQVLDEGEILWDDDWGNHRDDDNRDDDFDNDRDYDGSEMGR